MHGDLHVHTNLSDGLYAPEEVVKLAKKAGLEIISLTDHDTCISEENLKKLTKSNNIKIIRGIEFSTICEGDEIHILGYFQNCLTVELEKFLQTAQADRQRRILEGINNLKKKGIELSYEEVSRLSRGDSIGRSHLARVLVEHGFVSSALEAFQEYLKYDLKIVPPPTITVKKTIEIIRKNNGFAIWAHPPARLFDKYLGYLIELGLNGVEAYNRKKLKNTSFYYHTVAEKFGLIITAGSDWHGLEEEAFLTENQYPAEVINNFIKYFI